MAESDAAASGPGGSPWDDDPDLSADPPPRLAAAARMAADAVSALARQLVDAPVQVRFGVSTGGLLRGRIDVVRVELSGVATSGLAVDRLIFRGTDVRVRPGFPAARLLADSVTVGGVVQQASVDAWLLAEALPFRVELLADGLRGRASVAGATLGEAELRLEVRDGWLVLQPTGGKVLGIDNPLATLFRGYLPLPPLPSGARLVDVRHASGELLALFDFGPLDELLLPTLPGRLRERFGLRAR